MQKIVVFMITILAIPCFAFCRTPAATESLENSSKNVGESTLWIRENLDFATQQYKYFADSVKTKGDLFPRSLNDHEEVLLVPPSDWTSGFFPGGLWYLYEYSKDPHLKEMAAYFTRLLEKQSLNTSTHDLGFMMMSSFGQAYRLTGDETFVSVLTTSAATLARRYQSQVGCIRSWDFGTWKFPVIIDNVMNTELLYSRGMNGANSDLIAIANSHMDKTLKNHFRADGSSFHLVDYDPAAGAVLKRQTVQGYADRSAWARGQGWALYGFTMGYRFTKNPLYLEQAVRIADFILKHPHMPEDMVPPWDFDAPMARSAPRDSSAAAIYASALVELAGFVQADDRQRYIQAADTMLKALSSKAYRAEKVGDGRGFLLRHGVGWLADNGDVDRPLIYGDYYYIEALMRRLKG